MVENHNWPDRYEKVLEEHLPVYRQLPPKLQQRLRGLTLFFLDEKYFEACGDLDEVTEDMAVMISAQACLLLLNHHHSCYPKLRSILVYPASYKATDHEGGEQERLGESWDSGSVVLSWDHTRYGANNPSDGHNVAIHEFAHQLDQADGNADGAPNLSVTANCYRVWAAVLGKAYKKLLKKVESRQKTVIDEYGATNPAEFFAVATETFFEKPIPLKKRYPELYEELSTFYGIDWFEQD